MVGRVHVALEAEHADQPGARGIGIHQEGARGIAAQHVPDQAGDGGAVTGAGEAVRGAPLLQRLGRGHAVLLDGVDQFDGCGQPGSGSHLNLSDQDWLFLFADDLVGKPVSTFPDHART
ncbi:hypothetical protein ABIF62_008208 [Bradyrhizobium japonicum]